MRHNRVAVIKVIIKYGLIVRKKYLDSALPAYAGQAAFYMMLSFFPFLMFFFSLLKLAPISETELAAWTFSILPDALPFSEYIHEFIHGIYEHGAGLFSATIISAVFLSSKAFLALKQGLNSVYGVTEHRNYFVLRFFAMIYSVVFALLLLVMLGLMVFGEWLNVLLFSQIPIIAEAMNVVLGFKGWIFFLVLMFFFELMYFFMPNQKQNFRRQLPGAVLAALGWVLFSWGFSIYVDHFSNYASFYGAMTAIALLMVWLYACMFLFFLGGLVNSFLEP